MMRYPIRHKEESRERILASAAKQFRARGVEAVRVIDVMKAAGLTHGGFYKHFTHKDQILQEAIAQALSQISTQLVELTKGMSRTQALKTVIEFYLSAEHMQHPDLGCALAALGSEIARMPRSMKLEISKALDSYADQLSYLMPGDTEAQRRSVFLVLFPSMAGCIMTARAHADKERQRQLLLAARTFFVQTFCGESASVFQ